jgi:hypothetical protein
MKNTLKFKDVVHRVPVKFVDATLPESRKPYNLKTAVQPVLDIQGLAAKAGVLNLNCDPYVIEEGLTRGFELIYYFVAAGYRITTPLFNLRLRVPGEYDGDETQLPDGVYPAARLRCNPVFGKYLKEHVKIQFNGKEDSEGSIIKAIDEATGLKNQVMTRGNILTIKGVGIKLESDEERKDQMGVFFKPKTGVPIKASVIAWNAAKLLKVVVPQELEEGTAYQIAVETWSSPRGYPGVLKKAREIRSRFMLTTA